MRIDELEQGLADLAGGQAAGDPDPVHAVRRRVVGQRRRRLAMVSAIATIAVVAGVVVVANGRGPAQRVVTRPTGQPTDQSSTSLAPGEHALDARLTDDHTGWLLTDRRMLHTDDGGKTWTQADLSRLTYPPDPNATAILDGDHAWIATPDNPNGRILISFSADGARHITTAEVSPGMAALATVSLSFADADHGFLGVSNGTTPPNGTVLYATSDGGHTWELVASGVPVLQLRFANATDGWGVSDGLYRTTDGGHTWTRLHPPGWDQSGGPQPGGPGYDVLWQDGSRAVVQSTYSTGMLLDFRLLETTDGGATWRDIKPPSLGLINGTGPHPHLAVIAPGRFRVLVDGQAGATNNQIVRSDDDAATWSTASTNVSLTTLEPNYVSDKIGWVVAVPDDCSHPNCPSPLWETKNGGTSWTPLGGFPELSEAAKNSGPTTTTQAPGPGPTRSEVDAVMARTVPDNAPDAHYQSFDDPVVVSDGQGGTLAAAVGARTDTGNGAGQLVFFWHDDQFIGWDADHESYKLYAKVSGSDTIEVDYSWLQPGEAECCPSGLAAVHYRWGGKALQPDRALPPQVANGVHVHLVQPTPPTTTVAVPPIDSTPNVTFGGWTGREPAAIYFSGDAGNIAYDLTWIEWGDQTAVAHGTRNESSCEPSCADGTSTPYPVTITLSDPVDGQFTAATEVTNDGRGTTETFTSPTWAAGACTTWDPNSTDSCKFS